MTAWPRPAPDLDDPLFGPYWRGAAEGRLLVPRCRACATLQWPPRARCPVCGEHDLGWEDAPPAGTVHSHIVNHRAFYPSFEPEIPYVSLAVDVLDGVRMLGTLVDGDAVRTGAPVEAVFREVPEGFTLVCWRLS